MNKQTRTIKVSGTDEILYDLFAMRIAKELLKDFNNQQFNKSTSGGSNAQRSNFHKRIK